MLAEELLALVAVACPDADSKLILDWATPPVRLGLSGRNSGRNSGKTPETLSERFLEFPSRVRLGCPKPYNSRHLGLPEHFQNSLPPVRLGTPLFSEVVPERASQSRSWNSQQYWGYLWLILASASTARLESVRVLQIVID